jgi:putative FmdB family regulatory protein
MPIYEYKCNICKSKEEVLRPVKDLDKIILCECGGLKIKIISKSNFKFKQPYNIGKGD